LNIDISRPLRNHWFALRHGQSLANVEGIVVSDPANGCDGYGLTDTGRAQFQQSLALDRRQALGAIAPDHQALIVSSDFARAAQSAAIAAQLLQTDTDVQISKLLRERFFGRYELSSAEAYDTVWQADSKDATTATHGVEPVICVARRMAGLVEILDQQHLGRTIVLVSHGDPLQILECVFNAIPLSQHRELPPLDNAELRLLGSAPLQ
jgi:probable phosphoglycerate mutase